MTKDRLFIICAALLNLLLAVAVFSVRQEISYTREILELKISQLERRLDFEVKPAKYKEPKKL